MNLSMRGLAKLCTWNYSSISRLEKGRNTNPGLHNLLKLTDALELDISSLFRPDWTPPDMSLKNRTLEYAIKKSNPENEFDRIGTMAKAIKMRREELGMSTWKLQEKAEVSAITISRIECGKTLDPGFKTLMPLIDALNLDFSSYNKLGEHPSPTNWVKQTQKYNSRSYLEKQFNRILFQRNDALNNILPSNLSEKVLEKYYDGKMYIDVFAVQQSRQLPVFIESQKGVMDKTHYNKVVRLINSISEGTIIWISSGLRIRFFEDLDKVLKSTGKPIEVLVVEFNKDYLNTLKSLECMPLDKAYQKIMSSSFDLPFLELKKTFSSLPVNYVGSYQKPIQCYTGEILQENYLLLERLRLNFPYCLNLVRGKSNLHTPGIQIGSGIKEIEVKLVVACAQKKEASISVRTTNHTSLKVLEALKLKLYQIPFSTSIIDEKGFFTLNYGNDLSREAVMTRMHLDFGRILSVLMCFVQK